MAIMMSIDGISGSSVIAGYEGWLPLTSFDWGGARGTQQQRLGGGRPSLPSIVAAPQLRAVKVTRTSDHTTPDIWNLMLGMTRKKVQFVWLRTGTDKLIPYMKMQLDQGLITSLAELSSSDEPQETIAFTYAKVTITIINVAENLSGPQDVVTYDMQTTSLA